MRNPKKRQKLIPVEEVLGPAPGETTYRKSRTKLWLLIGFVDGGNDRMGKTVAVPVWRQIHVQSAPEAGDSDV